MCVIFWVTKTRPTQDMVERAFEHNKDGGGCAWRENEPAGADRAGESVVVWKKGLELDEMIELCATMPLPYIAHFRVASIGGIRPSLTHPFPINKNGSLALEGRTREHVLFHNGHWKEWNGYCMSAAVNSSTRIPVGRWSDTRAMAWLCSIYGNGFMEFLPEQKGVIFGPNDGDTQIFDGNGWSKINDVWCSNDFFMKVTGRGLGFQGQFCRLGSCTNTTLDTDGYCFMHPKGMPRLNTYTQSGVPTAPTGGSRVPPSPFVSRDPVVEVGGPTKTTKTEIISIETAETLYKEDRISKKLLKKIRRHWELATAPGKAGKRSEEALRQITSSMVIRPSLGSVH